MTSCSLQPQHDSSQNTNESLRIGQACPVNVYKSCAMPGTLDSNGPLDCKRICAIESQACAAGGEPRCRAGEPSTRTAYMPNFWASSCCSSTALSRDLLVRITSPAAQVQTLSSPSGCKTLLPSASSLKLASPASLKLKALRAGLLEQQGVVEGSHAAPVRNFCEASCKRLII